jgi:hypothetical protein
MLMPEEPNLQKWAEQFTREKRGLGAVFGDCFKNGMASGRAWEFAENAVQMGLMKVLKKYGEIPEHFASYRHFCNSVTRVALNWCRSEQRKRGNRQLSLAIDPMAGETDPRLEALRVCQDMLPDRQRMLMRLRWEDDLAFTELANALLPEDGRSRIARILCIRRQYHKAFEALVQLLFKHYPDLDWGDRSS